MLPYYLQDLRPDWLLSDNYLVLDFETTGINKGDPLVPDNTILMSGWYYGGYKYAWGDEYNQSKLTQDIESCDLIVCHHAKFEAGWLKRMGIDYGTTLMYDTLLGDYVIAGNRRLDLDLESCCQRWGLPGKEGVVSKMMKAGIPPEDTPRDWLRDYCLQDVAATRTLFLKQRRALNKAGLLPVMYSRCIVAPVLAAIEAGGLQLDKEAVYAEHEAQSRRYEEIESELAELLGDINTASPVQLAKALYQDLGFDEPKKYGKPDRNAPSKQFPDGQPKTDITTIRGLKAKNKKQKKIQDLLGEMSEVSASISKNLNYFKALCDEKGGELKGSFNQAVARTHRLSSSGRKTTFADGKSFGCQLQNLPRKYKRLFRARTGKLFAEVDYASLEWRAAGILGQDYQLETDVRNKVDVHTNAMEVLGGAGMEVDRTGAKQYTFKPQYSEPRTDKKKMTAPDKYAVWYKEHYSELAEAQRGWARQALAKKKLETPWGLVFHFPQCKLMPSGYIAETNKIYNYPIQSFGGAEIVNVGLVYLYFLCKERPSIQLVNTVHDSIEAEPDKDDIVWYAETCCKALLYHVYKHLKCVYGMEITIPLGMGFTFGTHWGVGTLEEGDLEGLEEALAAYGDTERRGQEVKLVNYYGDC